MLFLIGHSIKSRGNLLYTLLQLQQTLLICTVHIAMVARILSVIHLDLINAFVALTRYIEASVYLETVSNIIFLTCLTFYPFDFI